MSLVLFLNGSSLKLSNVERDEAGRISRAYVDNGWWWLVLKGNEAKAKSGRTIVNRWSVTSYEEVEVNFDGNYNNVIEAARKLRKHVSIPGS